MEWIFVGSEGFDPAFHYHVFEDFVGYGVTEFVFGREVVEERSFSERGFFEDVIDTHVVEAVFVDFPKGYLENLVPGFDWISNTLFHVGIIYHMVCIIKSLLHINSIWINNFIVS